LFANTVRRLVAANLAASSLCLLGCGGRADTPTGEVSGKVTFEKKAVREGRVTFTNPKAGTGDDALLQPDGTFALARPLPVGEYTVTVEPLIDRKQDDGKGPEVGVPRPAPDIPEKYRTIGTTELKAEVKEGKNDLHFDMKR
jgi:hypothetical protein